MMPEGFNKEIWEKALKTFTSDEKIELKEVTKTYNMLLKAKKEIYSKYSKKN